VLFPRVHSLVNQSWKYISLKAGGTLRDVLKNGMVKNVNATIY
jgi:hypothetical protein